MFDNFISFFGCVGFLFTMFCAALGFRVVVHAAWFAILDLDLRLRTHERQWRERRAELS